VFSVERAELFDMSQRLQKGKSEKKSGKKKRGEKKTDSIKSESSLLQAEE